MSVYRHIATLGLVLAAGNAVACPSTDQDGAPYRASGEALFDARHFAAEAGGPFDLARCTDVAPRTDTGDGFFPAAPQYSFQIDDLSQHQLVVSVISHCDAVLLVQTPLSAHYYDDNDNGDLHPRLIFTTPSSGRWDVWIGTRDGAFCDAVLTMESFDR